jgi:hypothetical protein
MFVQPGPQKIGPKIDAYCTAKKLVATRGKDAALVAERWALRAEMAGDAQRAATWRAVRKFVSKLYVVAAERKQQARTVAFSQPRLELV